MVNNVEERKAMVFCDREVAVVTALDKDDESHEAKTTVGDETDIDFGHQGREYGDEAFITGLRAVAVVTDDNGFAGAEESNAVAVATGDVSYASVDGPSGVSVATGDRSIAYGTGFHHPLPHPGVAVATGNKSIAVAVGPGIGIAVATDFGGAVYATAETLGLSFGTAVGSLGGWLVIAECRQEEGEERPTIVGIRSTLIDGITIKPDTLYRLHAGEFIAYGSLPPESLLFLHDED